MDCKHCGAKKAEHSFFEFEMRDRNENEIDLNNFKCKKVIVVINCNTPQEAEEEAYNYAPIEDKYGSDVQILCLTCERFFWKASHYDEEEKSLLQYLKDQSLNSWESSDHLSFIVTHRDGKENVDFIGQNVPVDKISEEIKNHLY